MVVEGPSGFLAVSSGRSIYVLDAHSPAKPRISWTDAHQDSRLPYILADVTRSQVVAA